MVKTTVCGILVLYIKIKKALWTDKLSVWDVHLVLINIHFKADLNKPFK